MQYLHFASSLHCLLSTVLDLGIVQTSATQNLRRGNFLKLDREAVLLQPQYMLWNEISKPSKFPPPYELNNIPIDNVNNFTMFFCVIPYSPLSPKTGQESIAGMRKFWWGTRNASQSHTFWVTGGWCIPRMSGNHNILRFFYQERKRRRFPNLRRLASLVPLPPPTREPTMPSRPNLGKALHLNSLWRELFSLHRVLLLTAGGGGVTDVIVSTFGIMN